MASRVAHGLNHRFQQGTPSGSIDRAGVVVRGFDKYTQGPGSHWLPGNHSAYDAAAWSASLISARYPFAYSKASDGGFVLEAAAATLCLQCSYEKDGNTAGVGPAVPSDKAVCIPGCVAASCQLHRGYWCNSSEGRAAQLRHTLEKQVRRVPFSYNTSKLTLTGGTGLGHGGTGKRHYHNEVIFNASCLRALLPHSIVAVVRNVHTFHPFTHEGYNERVYGEALAVHRNFLAAWNVSAVTVPLLELNLSDGARPFRPARRHPQQPAAPRHPKG